MLERNYKLFVFFEHNGCSDLEEDWEKYRLVVQVYPDLHLVHELKMCKALASMATVSLDGHKCNITFRYGDSVIPIEHTYYWAEYSKRPRWRRI